MLTFGLNARQAGHKDPEIVALYNDLRSQFSAIPGVRAATLSNHTLIGTGTSGTGVRVNGATPEDSSILTVGTGFFTTMQIPLLLGREIDERDQPNSPMVAVVNQAFAKRSFGFFYSAEVDLFKPSSVRAMLVSAASSVLREVAMFMRARFAPPRP